jgi:hypothetical protein
MRKGFTVDFTTAGGPVLDLAKVREDIGCHAQNAMVVLATSLGSDPVYPEKGTDMMKHALYGMFSTVEQTQHELNFAAVDAMFFVAENDHPAEGEERISDISLVAGNFEDPRTESGRHQTVYLKMTTSAGREIGEQPIFA